MTLGKFEDVESIFEGRLRGNQLMLSGLSIGPEKANLLWDSPRMQEVTWLDLDDNRLENLFREQVDALDQGSSSTATRAESHGPHEGLLRHIEGRVSRSPRGAAAAIPRRVSPVGGNRRRSKSAERPKADERPKSDERRR